MMLMAHDKFGDSKAIFVTVLCGTLNRGAICTPRSMSVALIIGPGRPAERPNMFLSRHQQLNSANI